MGAIPLWVLDLCAGEGKVWQSMREHYNLKSYTPCDRRPRLAGTIKGDAERLVDAFDLSRFNVIDVDTYGEPWECWLKIAARITSPTAVFLTHGATTRGVSLATISAAARAACGIPLEWDLPRSFDLVRFIGSFCLAHGGELCIIKIAFLVCLSNVSYFGLVCGPK